MKILSKQTHRLRSLLIKFPMRMLHLERFIETKSIETEVGNTIDLFTSPDWDMETEIEQPIPEFVNSVQIGALTDQVPMGVQTALLGGINLIVSETTMATTFDYQQRK